MCIRLCSCGITICCGLNLIRACALVWFITILTFIFHTLYNRKWKRKVYFDWLLNLAWPWFVNVDYFSSIQYSITCCVVRCNWCNLFLYEVVTTQILATLNLFYESKDWKILVHLLNNLTSFASSNFQLLASKIFYWNLLPKAIW